MNDLILDYKKEYENFIKTHTKEKENAENDLKNFLQKFPPEKITKEGLTLEEYCLGLGNRDNFSYWLEWETVSLGSIRGGSSYKFGVFSNKITYKFSSKFDNEHDAINKINIALKKIIKATTIDILEDEEIISILSPTVRYKVYFIYHYNPSNNNGILPIYNKYQAKECSLKLDKEINKDENLFFYQKFLLKKYAEVQNESKDPMSFMYFLYEMKSENQFFSYMKSSEENSKNTEAEEVIEEIEETKSKAIEAIQSQIDENNINLQKTERDIEKIKNDIPQYIGLFVAIFTAISIDIQALKTAENAYIVLGLIIGINTAPLLLFVLVKLFNERTIYLDNTEQNLNIKKDNSLKMIFTAFITIILMLAISFIFLDYGYKKIDDSKNQKNSLDNEKPLL